MTEQQKPDLATHPIYQIIGYLDKRAPFPIGSMLLGALSIVYLLNPTGGIIELIPDNIPFLGNLDETTVAFLLVWSGANVVRWGRVRRAQRKARECEQSKEER